MCVCVCVCDAVCSQTNQEPFSVGHFALFRVNHDSAFFICNVESDFHLTYVCFEASGISLQQITGRKVICNWKHFFSFLFVREGWCRKRVRYVASGRPHRCARRSEGFLVQPTQMLAHLLSMVLLDMQNISIFLFFIPFPPDFRRGRNSIT